MGRHFTDTIMARNLSLDCAKFVKGKMLYRNLPFRVATAIRTFHNIKKFRSNFNHY